MGVMGKSSTRARRSQRKLPVRERRAFTTIPGRRDWACDDCGKRMATIWPATNSWPSAWDGIFYVTKVRPPVERTFRFHDEHLWLDCTCGKQHRCDNVMSDLYYQLHAHPGDPVIASRAW